MRGAGHDIEGAPRVVARGKERWRHGGSVAVEG